LPRRHLVPFAFSRHSSSPSARPPATTPSSKPLLADEPLDARGPRPPRPPGRDPSSTRPKPPPGSGHPEGHAVRQDGEFRPAPFEPLGVLHREPPGWGVQQLQLHHVSRPGPQLLSVQPQPDLHVLDPAVRPATTLPRDR